MEREKLKGPTINVYLGNIELAQQRHKAYEKAAKALGMTKNNWCRTMLDRAADFKEVK